MKPTPLKNKVSDAGHYVPDTQVVRLKDVTSAVELLIEELKNELMKSDYLNTCDVIRKAFEDAIKNE